jgi:putative transposase
MNKSVVLKWNWSGSKKNLPPSVDDKRGLIEPDHPVLSVRRQCELIGLNRATYYYEPAKETPLNLTLMRMIDEKYMKVPFFGYPKMTEYLRKQGYWVNPKRIDRLMGLMGLRALVPKKRMTKSNPNHKVYPYLLRNVPIVRADQVWSADITYVPISQGFMYLVAILDWFSRYVLSWQLSNTLDNTFCLEALDRALEAKKPEIFNTDQGVQFTSNDFTERLESADVKISMDGRGRVFDNIFIERLWRTVKYENIYIRDYDTVIELHQGLDQYFQFYNNERFHQSLDYRTPTQVYYDCQRAEATDSDG